MGSMYLYSLGYVVRASYCDKVYAHLFYINYKRKRNLKKRREDIHQEVMNAWWHIHYAPASDYNILSIVR